jgi:hypothetical protein
MPTYGDSIWGGRVVGHTGLQSRYRQDSLRSSRCPAFSQANLYILKYALQHVPACLSANMVACMALDAVQRSTHPVEDHITEDQSLRGLNSSLDTIQKEGKEETQWGVSLEFECQRI